MIRTLVIDDDYRVARVHAVSVDRIDQFTSVGQAHTAAEARTMIQELTPDLLLLDLYLPDEGGLDLIRSLAPLQLATPPDFIVITAARDIENVRRAISLGAMYYLVKPFGFTQLAEQLTSYRRLRDGLEEAAVGNQQTIDTLFALMRGPSARSSGRTSLPLTTAQVLEHVSCSADGVGASEVAADLGVSRATAQRHLAELVRRNMVDLRLNYGTTGRPSTDTGSTTLRSATARCRAAQRWLSWRPAGLAMPRLATPRRLADMHAHHTKDSGAFDSATWLVKAAQLTTVPMEDMLPAS